MALYFSVFNCVVNGRILLWHFCPNQICNNQFATNVWTHKQRHRAPPRSDVLVQLCLYPFGNPNIRISNLISTWWLPENLQNNLKGLFNLGWFPAKQSSDIINVFHLDEINSWHCDSLIETIEVFLLWHGALVNTSVIYINNSVDLFSSVIAAHVASII